MKEPLIFNAIGTVENAFDEPTAAGKIRAAASRIILDLVCREA